MKFPCHRGHEIRLGITEMIGRAPQGCLGVVPALAAGQRFLLARSPELATNGRLRRPLDCR
jgi:hypothetical protein